MFIVRSPRGSWTALRELDTVMRHVNVLENEVLQADRGAGRVRPGGRGGTDHAARLPGEVRCEVTVYKRGVKPVAEVRPMIHYPGGRNLR
jgi:hypothetical protein